MNDTLIQFETAKLAKEKGFSAEWKSGQLSYNDDGELTGDDTNDYDAPSQFLLQKWLREKFRTDITVITDWINRERIYYVGCSYVSETGIEIWFDKDGSKSKVRHKTYELALEAGLLSALNLIQK